MISKLKSFLVLIIILQSLVCISQNSSLVSSADDSVEPWFFIALGDSRNWDENISNPVRESIFDTVVSDNPNMEFIIHTGDMVNDGGEQDDWDLFYADVDCLEENNITMYCAVGNHEMYTYSFPNGTYGPSETNFSTYMANVELPGNERFYSFDYNSIHFIFINTDEYFVYDGGYIYDITEEQLDWITNDLSTNTMNTTIAIFHRPCYSVRDSSRSIQASAIGAVLEPLFLEYNVILTFAGHDHYYYNTKRQGIQHIVTGGAGAPLANAGDTSGALENDVYFSDYHYCNVTVTESELLIDVHVFNESLNETTIEDTITISLENIVTTTPSSETTKTNTSSYLIISFSLLILASVWLKRRIEPYS